MCRPLSKTCFPDDMMLVRSPGHVSSIVDKVYPPAARTPVILRVYTHSYSYSPNPHKSPHPPHTHLYPLASLYTPHTLVLLTDQVLACCAVPRRPSAMATPRTASASGATPQDSRSKGGLALSRHPPTLKAHVH